MANSLFEDACGGRGVLFFVCFVGLDKGISSVVGLIDLSLDVGSFFEGLTSFTAELLHTEGVGGLNIEVSGIFEFFLSATEEAEAALSGGRSFVGLWRRKRNTRSAGERSIRRYGKWTYLGEKGSRILGHVAYRNGNEVELRVFYLLF